MAWPYTTTAVYLVQRSCLSRSFVTTELVSLTCWMSTSRKNGLTWRPHGHTMLYVRRKRRYSSRARHFSQHQHGHVLLAKQRHRLTTLRTPINNRGVLRYSARTSMALKYNRNSSWQPFEMTCTWYQDICVRRSTGNGINAVFNLYTTTVYTKNT